MDTENRSEIEENSGAVLNDAPFSALDAARDALVAWQNDARQEIERADAQLLATRAQLKTAQNEVASTREALQEAQGHAAQLRDEIAQRQAEAARLQNEIAATSQLLEATQKTLAGTREELAQERSEAARLQSEIAAATAHVSQLQAENSLHQNEAARLREDIESAGVALEATSGALASTRAELESERAAAAAAQQALDETNAHLAQARQELTDAHATLESERAHLASTRADLQSTQSAAAKAHQDLAKTQEELGRKHDLVEEVQRLAAHHEEQAERAREEGTLHQQRAEDACARLEVSEERRRRLHQELLEVYSDLRASDLPTLILRVAMRITGAENGLFADAEGTRAVASIGLDDLPKPIATALFDYTREAAQMEEPLVKNDSNELPDGANLVNLAALPVAVMGDLRGVILVANKRSAPFDHDDTELLLSIGKHAGIAIENHRLHEELANAFVSTIAVLADAIEAKDPYTRGHCESVASVATEVAQRIGLSSERVQNVRYAALLHDVGKIGVPDGILLKPGRLLPEEYTIIQKHSAIGRDLVSRVHSMENIAPIILHHHERIDGSGYPDGLEGENIPLEARIIGVIDAFDAMTTPRPYRDPVSPREAIEELQRCADSQFDRNLVDLAAQVVEEREAALRENASTSDA